MTETPVWVTCAIFILPGSGLTMGSVSPLVNHLLTQAT